VQELERRLQRLQGELRSALDGRQTLTRRLEDLDSRRVEHERATGQSQRCASRLHL